MIPAQTNNISEATQWLKNRRGVVLRQGTFIKDNWFAAWGRLWNKDHNTEQVRRIITEVQGVLHRALPNRRPLNEMEKERYVRLGEAIIYRYQGLSYGKKLQQLLRRFDCNLAQWRAEASFLFRENQKAFNKWTRYGYKPSIFFNHPDFCQFLAESGLLSQMKVTRDTIKEIGGEPAILVEGKWLKWSRIQERFEVVTSQRYKEKFIRDKNTFEIYTYLDNHLGLQQHHPYLNPLNPISRLNDDELERTLNKAREFIRFDETDLPRDDREELNFDRSFIVQVVSSFAKGRNSNISRLVFRSKHPYIRLIAGEDLPERNLRRGDVLNFGYSLQKSSGLWHRQKGHFRGPDVYEYVPCEQKIVTNIALDRREAKKILKFTTKYHTNGITLGNDVAFNFIHQNCSVFVQSALAAASIHIPTKTTLAIGISMIIPEKIKEIGKKLAAYSRSSVNHTKKLGKRILPIKTYSLCGKISDKISAWYMIIQHSILALMLTPARIVWEEGRGDVGQAFTQIGERSQVLERPLTHWRNLFDLSSYTYNLPGILQQWQRVQNSTVIYSNPVRLAIVPHAETARAHRRHPLRVQELPPPPLNLPDASS